MVVVSLLALFLQTVFVRVKPAIIELAEAIWRPLQKQEEMRSWPTDGMRQEAERSDMVWGALLSAACQQCLFWATAGVLLLCCGFCWWLRRRSSRKPEPGSSSHPVKESSSTNSDEEHISEDEDDNNDSWSDLALNFSNRIHWPMKTLAGRSRVVEQVVAALLRVCQKRLTKTFFPVLQPAIGVGSAFEGWCPDEDEANYHILLPLKPPRGHSFNLELGEMGAMLAEDSRIRVELQCTCTEEDMLCFIHTSEYELQTYQAPSLLHTLCTDSYLDVQRTASWFQDIVKSAWEAVPQSHHYGLQLLPSRWFCRMLLTSASGRSLSVVILFGVQQENSDIYLSSMPVDASAPSTTWPQTCAVAEAKFLRFMSRSPQLGSVHLRCLHLCACLLDGTIISTSTVKKVVMHLLHQSWQRQDLSVWCRKNFVLLLENTMFFLRCSLEDKRLDHIFLGNNELPEEIVLPPAFRTGKRVNIFQHLQRYPRLHASSLNAMDLLQDRLHSLLLYLRTKTCL